MIYFIDVRHGSKLPLWPSLLQTLKVETEPLMGLVLGESKQLSFHH